MTLIELTVSSLVLVVILGIALAVMFESEKSSRKIIQRKSAAEYCLQTIQQVSQVIQTAIPPVELASLKNQKAIAPLFQRDRLALVILDDVSTGSLCRVTISTAPSGENQPSEVQEEIDPIAEVSAGVAQKRAKALGTVPPSDFKTSIQFGYAKVASPSESLTVADTWPSDQWPSLIQITVTAVLDSEPNKPIVLHTAAIPGGRALVQPKVVVTPAPAMATPAPTPAAPPSGNSVAPAPASGSLPAPGMNPTPAAVTPTTPTTPTAMLRPAVDAPTAMLRSSHATREVRG